MWPFFSINFCIRKNVIFALLLPYFSISLVYTESENISFNHCLVYLRSGCGQVVAFVKSIFLLFFPFFCFYLETKRYLKIEKSRRTYTNKLWECTIRRKESGIFPLLIFFKFNGGHKSFLQEIYAIWIVATCKH